MILLYLMVYSIQKKMIATFCWGFQYVTTSNISIFGYL